MLTRLEKRTRGAGLFALAFLFVGLSAYAEKTDVVNLRNGDRMTGEVKGMNQGRLTFKTDTMDTVSIKWTEVMRIVTSYACEIELEDRSTYFGSLATSLRDGHLKLITEAGTMDFEIAAIVRITPIKSSFNERWDGYVTASLNYALFRYNVPKRDITVGMIVYQGLDGSDRLRSSFTANVRYEIVTDLFWDPQYYTDYDSAPPNSDAARSDLGIVTGSLLMNRPG